MMKRFFRQRPILGGTLAMLLAVVTCYIVVIPVTKLIVVLGNSTDEIKDTAVMVGELLTAIVALACLFIFRRFTRKQGFCGFYRVQGGDLRSVWRYIAIFAVVDLAGLAAALTEPGAISRFQAPSLAMIITAVYAGCNEEVTDRAIPLALMLRGKPDSRRIRLAIVVTTLVFSLAHLINLAAGQELMPTVLQIIFAAGMGLFLAGIYLRTGAMLLSRKHHQQIIDTWARIWPEDKGEAQA